MEKLNKKCSLSSDTIPYQINKNQTRKKEICRTR